MSGLYPQCRRKQPEMNLLPLIDVLVMLIFFAFVTMRFRAVSTLNITLPKVETAGKNELKGTVTIGVSNEGVMTFNGEVVEETQIEALLQQVRDVDRDIPVLIAADESTPLKTVAYLMDACRKAGLSKFSLQSR
ncbi:MAG: biopolymer transporter ExbD [Candidatus Synoicihabitans palmerolidicus]|nr:biopolymer transporter ExbD [Candidatus Synoicihabitans palmerolidicus]